MSMASIVVSLGILGLLLILLLILLLLLLLLLVLLGWSSVVVVHAVAAVSANQRAASTSILTLHVVFRGSIVGAWLQKSAFVPISAIKA